MPIHSSIAVIGIQIRQAKDAIGKQMKSDNRTCHLDIKLS